MWANGSPSYFSGLSSVPTVPLLRDRPAKNVDKTCVSQRDQTPDTTGNFLGLTELYLPAVEGPPSPESLRRMNAEMRLAANMRRGQGHKLASSSSSITSFTGDLDHALDNIDLVRRSSFTSVESGNISRDASEAFQQFSKSLFHRRGRSKQESTSSGSSLYSAEVPGGDMANASKESVIPKLFARRKPSRDDQAALQKRFQISGPFNFQHVTHTNRDAAEDAMLDDDQADAYPVKGRSRAATGTSDHTYTNVLAETVAEHGDVADFPPPRPGLIARHTGSFQTMRRFIKSGKIAELSMMPAPTSVPTNRQPPQRPPRSPLEPISPEPNSPSRPPRVSSRQSAYPAPIDTGISYFSERPLKSAGFQRPRPFSPSSPVEQLPTPTRQAFTPPAERSVFSQEGLLGRPRTATPEPAWPLASPTIANFEAPLPDLVEDDGHTSWSSRARTSHNSTNGSLRGSKSAPLMRKLAEEQEAEQQMETGAWKTELEESLCHSPTLGRASWEDDIDYCYEHEAEADCDYQWERPSLDVSHGMMCTAPQGYSALDEALMKPPTKRSPGMLSASGFEVPELSPASQTSAVLGHEAVTPLTNHAAGDSHFNQKCTELSVAINPHNSHEYQFSPSLLIPQEYQRESLKADNLMAHGLESSLQRSSTATTESNFTSSTDSAERHTSTNSSWTALTHHTASTSSLNKLTMSWVDEAEPVPGLAVTKAEQPTGDDETTPPASEDIVPELVMAMPPSNRRTMHKSHASESILRNSAAMDAQQLPKPRRPRARTSSLSQPPPVGQYALFPRSNIKAHGDKI